MDRETCTSIKNSESWKWKVYEIEAKVAEEAESITYGIYLRDAGTVWVDDVSIEIVGP